MNGSHGVTLKGRPDGRRRNHGPKAVFTLHHDSVNGYSAVNSVAGVAIHHALLRRWTSKAQLGNW